MADLFPPPLGTSIAGRFELLAPLRGDGAVLTYLAHDPQAGQRRALTLFDPACTTASAWAEYHRLVTTATEAEIPGLTLPPQVPATPPDPPHVVDDPPVNRSLDRLRAQEGRIPWQRALTIGERIAAVLHDAVEKTGVAHRALTPSRCTVGIADEVEVLDYGVAEIELVGEQLEEAEYRAPEQRNEKGDPRSDAFALAAILYELISGTCPSASPPMLSSLAPVPPAVDRLLDQALAVDPAQRPSNLAAMRAALREALGLPASKPETPANPPTVTPPASKQKTPANPPPKASPTLKPETPASAPPTASPTRKQETPATAPPTLEPETPASPLPTASPTRKPETASPTRKPETQASPLPTAAAHRSGVDSPSPQRPEQRPVTTPNPPVSPLRPLAGRPAPLKPVQSARAILSRAAQDASIERTERLPPSQQDTTLLLANTEDPPTERVSLFGARPNRPADPLDERTEVFQKRFPSHRSPPEVRTEKLPGKTPPPDRTEILNPSPSLPDRTEILSPQPARESPPPSDRTELQANPRLSAVPRPLPRSPGEDDDERTIVMGRIHGSPAQTSPKSASSSLDPTIGAMRVHDLSRPRRAQEAQAPEPSSPPSTPTPENPLRTTLLKVNLVLVLLLLVGVIVWALL
ncbi:serine/threonine protein kinase [Nannocystis punicea]|uniref:Protein kinase domain-containing protein n=1 Tax=Nannocystis punicea TaxID=2995304 RepID=A0ABY7HB01_9BACT|nr:hypothetical protein [Nannocystis poenicansa]WAS96431.1 hypothetical protein O0S08_09755 [Nannocystis poenicansa]